MFLVPCPPPPHTHTRTKAPGSALSPSGLHPASWTLSHPPSLLPLCQADGHVQSGFHPRPRCGRSAWASAWASGRRKLTGQRSCTGSVPESGAGRCGHSDPRLSPLCGPAVPVIRPLHSPGLQPRPLGSAAGHAGPAPWPLRTHAVGWRQSVSPLTPGQQGPSSARWPPCRSVQLPLPLPPQSPAPPPPLHGPPTWRREARPVLPSSGAAQLPSKATVHVCPAFSPLPKSPHALPCGPHAPASSPIPHARDTLSGARHRGPSPCLCSAAAARPGSARQVPATPPVRLQPGPPEFTGAHLLGRLPGRLWIRTELSLPASSRGCSSHSSVLRPEARRESWAPRSPSRPNGGLRAGTLKGGLPSPSEPGAGPCRRIPTRL